MPPKTSSSDATYFLGFDGGGTKTDCVLTDSEGRVLARGSAGPSNPLRTGYARAWFSLSDAGDAVLSAHKIHAGNIAGICAGLGGAGRTGVAHRVATFFQGAYPSAAVRVTTDLEIALEAAFGSGEGMILLAGTGSAAFGRDANARTVRAGGRGPWFSDEGSAFDIGRSAFRAVTVADEHRGPASELSKRILAWHDAPSWDFVGEQIVKNPDAVFPKTFPLVAELADGGDSVSQEILATGAASLVELAVAVANDLGWHEREIPLAKVGGVHGRSKYYDARIDAELQKSLPRARVLCPKCLRPKQPRGSPLATVVQREMPPEPVTRLDHARSASGDELKTLIHEAAEEILLALLGNPNMDESHVVLLLERLDLPATVLTAIAGEGKWASSESVRFGLARHPRTPKRFALAAVRQLFLFDLVRLSLLPSAPADIRRVAEEVILTRIPHLAIGEKLTLARRGPSRVAGALLAEGHPQALKLALANPFLTESQVLKALAKRDIPERAVAAVAHHPKWSAQYNVRVALLRNSHTSAKSVLTILPHITSPDLKEIANLDDLAPHLKKYLEQEIASRAERR